MLGLPQTSRTGTGAWFDRVLDEASLQGALQAHIAGRPSISSTSIASGTRTGAIGGIVPRRRRPTARSHRHENRGSQTDITERAAIQEQLQHAAVHDALTGLPNRLLSGAAGECSTERQPDHVFAVLSRHRSLRSSTTALVT
jgi:hypothetical protein